MNLGINSEQKIQLSEILEVCLGEEPNPRFTLFQALLLQHFQYIQESCKPAMSYSYILTEADCD